MVKWTWAVKTGVLRAGDEGGFLLEVTGGKVWQLDILDKQAAEPMLGRCVRIEGVRTGVDRIDVYGFDLKDK